MLKKVLLSATLAALVPALPALACGSGAPTAWFQPTTVQKHDSFLVTGTNVAPGDALLFSFFNGVENKWIHYTAQQNANGNCVVNQEYIDTSDFKKGTWFVAATEYNSYGFTEGANMLSTQLRVVDRTSPAPVLSAYPCGQAAHAWYGPSTVIHRNSQMYVAAIGLPGRYVDFYFVSSSGGIGSYPGGLARRPLRTGPAANNCVVNQVTFTAGSALSVGSYTVHAGYFDEFGRYRYSFLGSLTIT